MNLSPAGKQNDDNTLVTFLVSEEVTKHYFLKFLLTRMLRL
jgi:hypothetical protein